MPRRGITDVAKDLEIEGGIMTAIEAVAEFPVPALDVMALVTFVCKPSATPLRFTVTVHDALAAITPLERESDAGGPVAATATPPQVLANPLGVAMARPAGSGSEN